MHAVGGFQGFGAAAARGLEGASGRSGPSSADAAERAARNGTREEPRTADEIASGIVASFRASTQRSSGTTPEARRGTVAATEQLSYLIAGQPPEVQAAVLRGAQAELAQLTRQLEHLSHEETGRAVAALTRVANSVGSDQVRLLTDTMARELPEVLASDRGRSEGRVLGAMQDAIEGGDGALLATAMARSLENDGHTELATEVHERAAESVAVVRERYSEARAEVDARNAELALVQTTWSGALDEDAQQAGMEAFLQQHEGDYAELDEATAVLAATLEGASYGMTAPAGLSEDTDRSAFVGAVAMVPELARTEAGSAVIVDAMSRSAEGRASFLDGSQRLSRIRGAVEGLGPWGRTDSGTDSDAAHDAMLMEAISVQTDAAARQGDVSSLDRMLGEFAAYTGDPELAQTAEQIQEGIAEAWAEYEEGGGIIGELDALGSLGALQSKISRTFRDVSKHYLSDRPALQGRFDSIGLSFATGSTISAFAVAAVDPGADSFLDAAGSGLKTLDTRARNRNPALDGSTRWGRVGAAAGLAGGVVNVIQDPTSVRAHLEAVADGAGLANTSRMFSSKPFMGQALKRAGVVAGAFFSAWDTLEALDRGDTYGAAAAAAPLAGMAIGAMVGPGGAAVGLVVGGVIGIGMELFRAFSMNDPTLQFEQRTQPFLMAAFESMGMSESDADQLSHRFRDANDDLVGVGPALAGLAGHLGVSSDAMLQWAAGLSDWQAKTLAKRLLRVDHESERLWEASQGAPGEGRNPRDPLSISLDHGQMEDVAGYVRNIMPPGPWSASEAGG